MGCGCNDPINSWYDWAHQMPADILDLVAMARLGGTVGTFLGSDSHRGGWEVRHSNEKLKIVAMQKQQQSVLVHFHAFGK